MVKGEVRLAYTPNCVLVDIGAAFTSRAHSVHFSQ